MNIEPITVTRSAPIPPVFPLPQTIMPSLGGIQFRDAAPLVCGVVDNGVTWDDPRVLLRVNEATKIILDTMIPVGGMLNANITAIDTILVLPPELENVIEAHPVEGTATVFGDGDDTQSWYEILNNSIYLDPNQSHDNPFIDRGLWPDTNAAQPFLRRLYEFPGLEPDNSIVNVTGKRRYIPLQGEEDFLIVQNIEAIKLIILSIERFENNAADEGKKYRQEGFEILQNEVRNHILDPRNYMFRKAAYQQDIATFPPETMGWVRAQIALDIPMALKSGKIDLTWNINKSEQRLMQRMITKDSIIQIQADVTGGSVYFPINVGAVLALTLDGTPIPLRSQFFEALENGPGRFPQHPMLIDQGDEYFAGTQTTRRKYKLTSDCTNVMTVNAVCKLRWIMKQPQDLMVIKNYEAIRLVMMSLFMEEQEKFQDAQMFQAQAIQLLDDELREYLRGIRHTIHVQMHGFGLGDVGGMWGM